MSFTVTQGKLSRRRVEQTYTPSTYHAMLQECGMKGLQNSLVSAESSSLAPNTCEGAPNFALTVNQHSKSQCVVMPPWCSI